MYLASSEKPSAKGLQSYNASIDDSQVYEFAARFAKFLLNGLAVKKGVGPEDVDPEELKMGIEVEREHCGGDTGIATRIALDHLAEFPKYYSMLKFMEAYLKGEYK